MTYESGYFCPPVFISSVGVTIGRIKTLFQKRTSSLGAIYNKFTDTKAEPRCCRTSSRREERV